MKLLTYQAHATNAVILCEVCGAVKPQDFRNWALEDPQATDGFEYSDEFLQEGERYQSAFHFPTEEDLAEEAKIVKEYFEELAKNGG